MIIAIDGPAGAGKSTLAKHIARELGLQLIETGALYRAVGWLARIHAIELENVPQLAAIATNLDLHFAYQNDTNHVWYQNQDITDALRTQQAGQDASKLSVYPQVREALLEQQRKLAHAQDSVLEGRDIGTVVCPDADVKFFITASPEIRAERRLKELESNGISRNYDEILREIVERDARDTSREIAPLIPAKDAVHIDASKRAVNDILRQMLEVIDRRTTQNNQRS